MHDSLLSHAILVCGASVFQCLLQRRPHVVARCRLRLFSGIRAGRFPFHANQFQKLGLAQLVGDMGRFVMVSFDGGPRT